MLGGFGSPPVLLALTLAGSVLGSLLREFPRARIFMGNASIAPLGFLLVRSVGWWLLIPLVLLQAHFRGGQQPTLLTSKKPSGAMLASPMKIRALGKLCSRDPSTEPARVSASSTGGLQTRRAQLPANNATRSRTDRK